MDRKEAKDILDGYRLLLAEETDLRHAFDLAIEALGEPTISEKESVEGDAESATTTDCISRADTINAMCRECKMTKSWGWCEKDCTEVAIVRGMPSMSEEEVDYCNNCPYISWDEDCISRQ